MQRAQGSLPLRLPALIGLGGLIVQNVRDVEGRLLLEQFMDPAQSIVQV
jgi:hypothetical protein